MNPIRTIILFGNLLFVLAFVNWGIWTAEQNIAAGELAYLELAPVDPRSIFQGDYMLLNYAIEQQAPISRSGGGFEQDGFLVVVIDEQRIARFLRFYEGEDLAEGEILIKYFSPYGWGVEIGIDSFFFQEGTGDTYARARYAEVRILDDGSVSLIGLRGENLEELRAPNQETR